MSTLDRIQRLEKVEQDRLERKAQIEQERSGKLAAGGHGLERYERLARTPMAALFVLWAVMLVEYAVRLVVAPDRRGYVASRRIEPAVAALQPLRLFGLDRVSLISTELALRTKAILQHRGLFRVLLAAIGLLFIGSWLVLLAERDASGSNIRSFWQALWWGIVTVGYGDRYPVTGLGRSVAVVLMLVGIGLLGVITATVASFFVHEHTDANKTQIQEAHQNLGAQLTALAHIVTLLDGQAGETPSPPPPVPRGTILK